jgi:zinc transport system substrate-binding protein
MKCFFLFLSLFFSSLMGTPSIITTLPPYAFLLEKLVEKKASVTSLFEESSDPHEGEVSPRKLLSLKEASLIFWTGDPHEKKIIERVVEKNPKIVVVSLADGIKNKLPGFCSSCFYEPLDFHFWLNPKTLCYQVEVMTKALVTLMPSEKELLFANSQSLLEKLSLLHLEIEKKLAPLQGRSILISHPCLTYFCKQYQLTQIPIEIEGKSPLPNQVMDMLARGKKAICIFATSGSTNQGAFFMEKRLGIPLYSFNPLAKDPLQTISSITNDITKS